MGRARDTCAETKTQTHAHGMIRCVRQRRVKVVQAEPRGIGALQHRSTATSQEGNILARQQRGKRPGRSRALRKGNTLIRITRISTEKIAAEFKVFERPLKDIVHVVCNLLPLGILEKK